LLRYQSTHADDLHLFEDFYAMREIEMEFNVYPSPEKITPSLGGSDFISAPEYAEEKMDTF